MRKPAPKKWLHTRLARLAMSVQSPFVMRLPKTAGVFTSTRYHALPRNGW